MHPVLEHQRHLTRRELLQGAGLSVGSIALAGLLQQDGLADSSSVGGLPELPHFAPKAKHVIYLFQNGAPTHVDLFDWKPKLVEMHGEPVPEEAVKGQRFSTMTGNATG
ncbi:MAG: DUF1501 domain-containing protein, partial [Planctomycetaceae bacterium]|nr:DUF1501 domain-containing protein [Planctomycetaceae bacterium]